MSNFLHYLSDNHSATLSPLCMGIEQSEGGLNKTALHSLRNQMQVITLAAEMRDYHLVHKAAARARLLLELLCTEQRKIEIDLALEKLPTDIKQKPLLAAVATAP